VKKFYSLEIGSPDCVFIGYLLKQRVKDKLLPLKRPR